MRRYDPTLATLAVLATLTAPTLALACPGVGVIVRIEGRPQDVVIMRADDGGARAAVSRPRVLEVLCEGDTIRAEGGAVVTLSLDGSPSFKVQGAQPYTVGARRGAPTLAGNAYRNVARNVLPDMKRQPWDVRLRGPGRELGFAVTSLGAGHQTLVAGRRDLLVRIDGGVGGYTVKLSRDGGATVGEATGSSSDVVLRGVDLAPGAYRIKVTDTSSASAEAGVTVVTGGPPLSPDYVGMSDPEVEAAARAADLAREHADTWSLEAEQILQAAPVGQLDRDSVYDLIESYGPA